jgi:hypothetical protein
MASIMYAIRSIVIARVKGIKSDMAMMGDMVIEIMIMNMAKANCSNMKNLTSLIKLEDAFGHCLPTIVTPSGSARPRMNKEPTEKAMVITIPRTPKTVLTTVSTTTLVASSKAFSRGDDGISISRSDDGEDTDK